MSYYTQLTLVQRYLIYVLLRFGFSQAVTAEVVGVNKSTISREVRRNSGARGYRWRLTAWVRAGAPAGQVEGAFDAGRLGAGGDEVARAVESGAD